MKFDHVAYIHTGQGRENIGLNKRDRDFESVDDDGESEG